MRPPLTPSHAHTQIGYVYNYVYIHTVCIEHILIHAVYLSPALSMSMHYILNLYTWLVSDPEVYRYDRCSHSLFLSFLRARIASTAPLTCASEKNLLVLLWQSWIEDSPLWTEIAELFHELSLAFCFSLCVRVWQTCDKPLGTGIKRNAHKMQGAIGCHECIVGYGWLWSSEAGTMYAGMFFLFFPPHQPIIPSCSIWSCVSCALHVKQNLQRPDVWRPGLCQLYPQGCFFSSCLQHQNT